MALYCLADPQNVPLTDSIVANSSSTTNDEEFKSDQIFEEIKQRAHQVFFFTCLVIDYKIFLGS